MIILDTNVVSEPLRPTDDPAVLSWLDQQDIETLYLTTVAVAELRFGIAALPLEKNDSTWKTNSNDVFFLSLRDASFRSTRL